MLGERLGVAEPLRVMDALGVPVLLGLPVWEFDGEHTVLRPSSSMPGQPSGSGSHAPPLVETRGATASAKPRAGTAAGSEAYTL